MAADEKQGSALMKRHEQKKRWEDSDTNLQPVVPKNKQTAVNFQDGCMFLAACSSGDKAEVEKLLRSLRSADINTANVDGLTALHQACIDDNLEMVEFLVEHGADINVCDNEGWTPLHATASCAYLDIARYLINHNANVAAVNNDGDLPIDIAENEEMENMLQEEMDRQGIDAEAARCEEEQCMLEDANLWLSQKIVKEIQHPKTGATALHVAAAKGYIKVMNLLLEAGVDINAEDYDGWTPLHAAAHWGQDEACEILVENMCDMSRKNKAGHTAFDIAENSTLLQELKDKQDSMRNKQARDTDIILTSGYGGQRKNSGSITRMSGSEKQNVIHRTSEEERAAQTSHHSGKTDNKIPSSISVTDSMIVDGHRNDRIKHVPQQPQRQENLAPGQDSSAGSLTATTTKTTDTDVKSSERSYEPSKREEETETQRKTRAKHARQTRRSTQGVSLEDIEKAEESLNRDKDSSDISTTSSRTTSSHNSALRRETAFVSNGETPNSTAIHTATTTTTTAGSNDPGPKEDRTITSGYRRWSSEDKNDSADVPSTRGSFRKSREDRDPIPSKVVPDVTTNYIPRSQRTSALQPGDITSATSNQSMQRPSLTSHQSDPTPKAEKESKKNESSTQEKKEEKKEPSSIRARRQRRERRSTGITMDGEDGETSKDNKSEEDKDDDAQDGLYDSSSDSKHTEVSKPAGYLDVDYKKKYEEEKAENERIKKELEKSKKEFQEVKTELDRVNRQRENSRNSDRDKRALEKKVSEMEEELKKLEHLKTSNQRLKDENGALIRVISKLSK